MGQSESVGEVRRPSDSARYGDKVILGKYTIDMSEDGIMGEGSFSTCRRGLNKETGEGVAIKFFKTKKVDSTQLFKFKRQITVLKDLQAPFIKPSNPRLWSPQLEKAQPSRLFMRLIDYSKDAQGEPGVDVGDGVLEVVTELAQYSLQDYLTGKKQESAHMSKDTVKSIAKALLLVMAGLHVKGLVHLDMKPENLMVFDGCLKLIDVDGCVKIGSNIKIDDPSISFSPCYCAPEWARFLVDPDHNPSIEASQGLDVWSVGCTICELVTLDAIMKPVYANVLRRAHSHREASFLFLDWLGSLKKCPLPKEIRKCDDKLAQMVQTSILVPSYQDRKTCAECLADEYFRGGVFHRSKTSPITKEADAEDPHEPLKMPATQSRQMRHRQKDHSTVPLHHGALWKLNSGKDPMDAAEWLQRDMWIANNGSLCYYSQREETRLVILDSHHLHGADITKLVKSGRQYAFKIDTKHIEAPGDGPVAYFFAGESAEDTEKWMQYLMAASRMEVMPTMKLGASVAQAASRYKLTVKNRRQNVAKGTEHEYAPVFKEKLWKVKADGDRMQAGDWFEREMWLATNGSLVYWSERDQRNLVYYTTLDIQRASLVKIPNEKSLKPWTFQVRLPPNDGLEFAPGEFAAPSEAMRDRWIQEFAATKRRHGGSCFSFMAWCR